MSIINMMFIEIFYLFFRVPIIWSFSSSEYQNQLDNSFSVRLQPIHIPSCKRHIRMHGVISFGFSLFVLLIQDHKLQSTVPMQ
jgi:hypothetical protein